MPHLKKSIRKSRSRKEKNENKEKKTCKEHLSKKIAINLKEYKQGRYKSPKQAIAVSYSQVKKYYPECEKILKMKKSVRKSRVKV
jgi:hypothetical protein